MEAIPGRGMRSGRRVRAASSASPRTALGCREQPAGSSLQGRTPRVRHTQAARAQQHRAEPSPCPAAGSSSAAGFNPRMSQLSLLWLQRCSCRISSNTKVLTLPEKRFSPAIAAAAEGCLLTAASLMRDGNSSGNPTLQLHTQLSGTTSSQV